MQPKRHPRPTVVRALLLILGCWLLAPGFAYGGFTVGAGTGLPSGGAYVANVRLAQPVLSFTVADELVRFAVRADVAAPLSFDTLPALGISGVTGAELGGVGRYLGVGVGVSAPVVAGGEPLWSVFGLAGLRVPLFTGLAAAFEVQLVSNRLFTAPQLGLALEYTFGARP